ncbi:hypothetical protein B0H11DRAFT_2215479 [Mycena galericulata]|nr:hypothetical protein B0H11DRAFT_2215479 [Mycena galericulata]
MPRDFPRPPRHMTSTKRSSQLSLTMDPSTRDLILQSIRDLEFAPPPKKPATCGQCMVDGHTQNPLHRIEMWTNTGLVGVTLKTAGLRIRLGHRLGDLCPERIVDNDFVITDTDGLHEVAIDYCGCEPRRSRGRQLRDARFFPSGDTSPRTAVAFTMAQLLYTGTAPITMRVRRVSRG